MYKKKIKLLLFFLSLSISGIYCQHHIEIVYDFDIQDQMATVFNDHFSIPKDSVKILSITN